MFKATMSILLPCFDKIGISQEGMDGVKFSDTPKNAVSKISKYFSNEGSKDKPITSPYWYDYKSSLTYWHEINNVYPDFCIDFTGNLSRQTYRTKRVIDYSFYDYYWYHDEKIPTGYVWNSVSINSFQITFDNKGKLLGKLHMLFEALTNRFKNMGKIEKQNNGAAVITLKNGKTAFIYMKPNEVNIIWGKIGAASSISIDKYKNVKEDMGTKEEVPTGIRWDFESNGSNGDSDLATADSVAVDSTAY